RMLFDEAQMEAQRALALAEVGQLATRIGSEFERNISEVFARVAEPASYDRWLLMLTNEEDPNILEKVTLHSPEIPDSSASLTLDLRTAEHSAADSVREDRVLLVNDPAHYPAFTGATLDYIRIVGKHVVTPIHIGGRVAGVISIGRALEHADLDERDEQLVRTLAAQVAVAIENRSLFRAAESEREYLRSILETMPTGIMVLDAKSFKPIQVNAQAESLLGKPIKYDEPFNVTYYNLLRTGTNVHYPQDELPIFVVPQLDGQAFSDDIAAIHEDGSQTDLLLNAAPVRDSRGNITAIVAAFQDISNLRGLENALQNNLRETIALYEATRSLSEAGELDEVLDATVGQLIMLEPTDGYIVLLNEATGDLQAVRGVYAPEQFGLPSELFDANRVMISDIDIHTSLDQDTRDMLKGMNIASVAVIPMRARDVLLGWVSVVFEQPHEFTPEDERFLTTLSDSAAVAIDNRNLFQSTEIAYQEAATLYETSRVLANASTPEDIVSAVVNQMRQPHITQAFMAVPVVERDGQIEAMQVVANWQKDDNSINLLGVTLTADQFPAWRQVASNTILTIDDIDEDTTLTDMERLGLMSTDTKALAVLPLRAGQRRIGVIWMGSPIAYEHSERDVRLYRSFIEQASLSLEATRLLKQTERRARQLATSAQVSQFASSILDMSQLLPRLVDLIRDSFNYDHVQVFLMDPNDQFAELRASTGEAGQQLLGIKHKLAKGSASVIGTVTATGQPAIALDTADARFVHKPNPYLPLTRSEMALPLIVKNRVVGALDVQSNQPNAFGEEDVTVLTTLAAQISVALDNARLFEQSESRARDMAFLFNVTSAAANPNLGLKEALQNVATLVRNSFDALNVTMYLMETYTTEDDVEHSLLRAAALAGSSQPLTEIAEIYVGDEQNILASIATDLDPVVVMDIEEEPRYLPITSTARSAVAVPMTAGNQVVGVIAMEDDRPNAFDEQSVNLLRALTSTLSAIVQNAQLLQEVQRSNEQLRELDRLKSDFLANMSHELRTPLNSIIGFSRVILKGIDGPLTEMQEQDLSTIYNSGTHLLGLINDILDQAKINSGKMDLHLDYFDVKPVVEGVRSIGIGLVKDKPIDLRLDVASGMPKAYGDEFRTRQVLLNLVSNASKFTQQGSVTIQVYTEVHPDTQKTMIRIDVVDTGIGIAETDLPLLFEAFRQVDSSLTRTVGGTGLGLPIAKSLIEMQGGLMLVKSEVNAGSTFSILLPLEPTAPAVSPEAGTQPGEKPTKKTGPLSEAPAESNSDPTPPTRPAMAQTGQLPPMPENTPDSKKSNGSRETLETSPAREKRMSFIPNVMPSKRQILLIEDNPDMVDQYRRTLQREGFDIFAASIPLEAEAMASGLRPTLIVMDVNFSKGAGWDIMTRLQGRDDTHDIPVIVVTLSNELERIQASGAFRTIQRPFTPEQLVEAVKQAEVESQTQRILIIDDQPDSTRLLKDVLNENGHYRVFEAHSGHEGVSMIARMRPDLIILDLRMPEMDGFAVLDELQANPETANIPVMVITADTLNADEQGH
ncbi:MAG: GAF domain-containing protein, partial [Anaerolineae bacterium]|nr:GAF domain-containing protein [Anaerolineae bacterium]